MPSPSPAARPTTAYLADYVLTEDDFGFSAPEVPAAGNLVQLSVTIFNAETTPDPLEAGTEIAYTAEFGELTFTVVHQQATEAFGTASNADGVLTVTAVGDTFCAEVDYADDEKELRHHRSRGHHRAVEPLATQPDPGATLTSSTRASGGIGRRAGFRCQCPKGRGGSSPPSPTTPGADAPGKSVQVPTLRFGSDTRPEHRDVPPASWPSPPGGRSAALRPPPIPPATRLAARRPPARRRLPGWRPCPSVGRWPTARRSSGSLPTDRWELRAGGRSDRRDAGRQRRRSDAGGGPARCPSPARPRSATSW